MAISSISNELLTKELLLAYEKWLPLHAGIQANSAYSYRQPYINGIRKRVADILGTDYFEYLPDLSWRVDNSVLSSFETVCRAILPRVSSTLQNYWCAFPLYLEFLNFFREDGNVDIRSHVVTINGIQYKYTKTPKAVQNDIKTAAAPYMGSRIMYTKGELNQNFCFRLATQNRIRVKDEVFFPIKDIKAVFDEAEDSRLREWMLQDLKNMHVLVDKDGTFKKFRSIGSIIIDRKEKKTSIMVRNREYPMYTEKVDKSGAVSIVEMPAAELRDITIDHHIPIKKAFDDKLSEYRTLKELSDKMAAYYRTEGITVAYKKNKSNDITQLYFNEHKADFDKKWRDGVINDLQILSKNTDFYVLMYGKYNSSKSAK